MNRLIEGEVDALADVTSNVPPTILIRCLFELLRGHSSQVFLCRLWSQFPTTLPVDSPHASVTWSKTGSLVVLVQTRYPRVLRRLNWRLGDSPFSCLCSLPSQVWRVPSVAVPMIPCANCVLWMKILLLTLVKQRLSVYRGPCHSSRLVEALLPLKTIRQSYSMSICDRGAFGPASEKSPLSGLVAEYATIASLSGHSRCSLHFPVWYAARVIEHSGWCQALSLQRCISDIEVSERCGTRFIVVLWSPRNAYASVFVVVLLCFLCNFRKFEPTVKENACNNFMEFCFFYRSLLGKVKTVSQLPSVDRLFEYTDRECQGYLLEFLKLLSSST